jgi:hypothetical protein
MQFTGPPYTYSFTPIITNCTIASQNAVAVAGNVAFWMGNNKFYMYNGQVQTLVCDVKRKVFGDINVSQIQQVCAGTNEAFNEIWWFYPSTNATVNDRYVVYNYVENIWYYGALSRTAWVDSKLRGYPIAAYTADSVNGRLIYQEFGLDDLTTSSSTAIAAYVESAEFDITDGEHVMFIQRAIPDVMYNNSTAPAPTGTLTVSTRNFPGNSTYQSNANNVVQTVATPVPVYTNDIWIRLRGRQAKFRFESNALGVMWQLGTPRLDVKPDGKR